MRNADFTNVKPMNNSFEVPPKTKFEILSPAEGGRFVLVLDRSTSMNDNRDPTRMERIKQSSIRWIRYDVINGTQIGITSFESLGQAIVDKDIVKVTDSNREVFASVINSLIANGGTCLGTGLMKGMDVSI